MNRISFLNRGYAFKGLLAVIILLISLCQFDLFSNYAFLT